MLLISILVSIQYQLKNKHFPAFTLVENMPNIIKSMNCKHKNCIDELSVILLRPKVVPPTGSGRAQNDIFMVSDSLFANFLIIIHETKN